MIKKVIHKHKHLLSQMMRFSVVGLSSTVVHFTCVILLVEFEALKPLTANIIAFLVAFLVSFFGHRYWTFADTTRSFRHTLPRFLSIAIMSFIINESLYWYLLHIQNMYYPVALIIVLAAVSVFTFTLSKLWAFRQGETA